MPDPFNLNDWLEKNKEALNNGEALSLFGDTHPDKEFKVLVVGGQSKQEKQCWKHDRNMPEKCHISIGFGNKRRSVLSPLPCGRPRP